MRTRRTIAFAISASAAALLAGCASAPAPVAAQPKAGGAVRAANLTERPLYVAFPKQPVGAEVPSGSSTPFQKKRTGDTELTVGTSATSARQLSVKIGEEPQTIFLLGSAASPQIKIVTGDTVDPKDDASTALRAVNLTDKPVTFKFDGVGEITLPAGAGGSIQDRQPGTVKVAASSGGAALAERTFEMEPGMSYTAVAARSGGKGQVFVLASSSKMNTQVVVGAAAGG